MPHLCNMKKTVIFILIVSSFCIRCGTTSSSPVDHLTKQKMEKQDKQQIETLLMNYKESLNTSNVGKAVDLYAKNGVFMPSQGPSAIGLDKIKGAYEFVFSQIQLNIEFFIEDITVENNLAYATTTSKGSTLIHASGATVPEENRELFVFEKEGEQWKIARYMFNKMKGE